jgi:predicted AAA+ superfamily ATPase
MQETISRIIDEFHERDFPNPVPRDRTAVEVEGKATTVVGMRRVGKTWFCYERMRALLDEGVAKERLLYLNFEDERLLPFAAADFQTILDSYYRKFPDFKEDRCYLFLDEIQRIEGWEKFVRRILDTENLSVWVTGSSSKLLSTEIATSLRGRSSALGRGPSCSTKQIAIWN